MLYKIIMLSSVMFHCKILIFVLGGADMLLCLIINKWCIHVYCTSMSFLWQKQQGYKDWVHNGASTDHGLSKCMNRNKEFSPKLAKSTRQGYLKKKKITSSSMPELLSFHQTTSDFCCWVFKISFLGELWAPAECLLAQFYSTVGRHFYSRCL